MTLSRLLSGLTATTPLLMASCVSVVDLSSREASTCEVHKTRMEVEAVRGSTGYPGYVPGYIEVMEQEFPHHRGQRLLGAEYPAVKVEQVKVHVCSECDEAYRTYWAERNS